MDWFIVGSSSEETNILDLLNLISSRTGAEVIQNMFHSKMVCVSASPNNIISSVKKCG